MPAGNNDADYQMVKDMGGLLDTRHTQGIAH